MDISGVYCGRFEVLDGFFISVMPFAFSGSIASRIGPRWPNIRAGPASFAQLRNGHAPMRSRLELLGTVAFPAPRFANPAFTCDRRLLCYGVWAAMRARLQYADHALSPSEVVDESLGSSCTSWVQADFLNYHLHLAHHRHPHCPGFTATGTSISQGAFQGFWCSMLECGLGPRPANLAFSQ